MLLPLGGCGVLDHGMLGAAGSVADQTRSLFLLFCAIVVLVAAPMMLTAGGAGLVMISLAVGAFSTGGWSGYPPYTGKAFQPGVGADYWI
ncbi:hypothetical protein [Methylobacterium sp. Leaf456]|uniref:hypothetical protein n=1 Tax=Methylobacterium sp. Leaf456 TaxID=1736382 RepID=UPI0006FC8C23|nr:hypothetical protein [Methylobacterium sp. Leaf456]